MTEAALIQVAAEVIDGWAMAFNGYNDFARQKRDTAIDTATRVVRTMLAALSLSPDGGEGLKRLPPNEPEGRGPA